jgi:hypothetical protein
VEEAEGLMNGRHGPVSGRRVPVDRIEWVLEQYRTALLRLHGQNISMSGWSASTSSRSATWLHLDQARAADGGAGWRPGAQALGESQEATAGCCEASCCFRTARFEWLAGQPALDLIATMDDATMRRYLQPRFYSAFLIEEKKHLKHPGKKR